MSTIMNRIRKIITFSIVLITALAGIIIYQIATYETPAADFYCKIPVPFCGTPILSENQVKGKQIFNSNCAACHKLDAKSTGPALRGVDSLIFTKWIIAKNHKIDTTKIKELGIDYHRTKFTEYIKEADLELIIDYCSSERH
ncbi:c-type cytochrome [Flavobacterium procerum]|uniref:C-type cytochrome n=1 Tax=Flavobacterium procerum TaxID=1455569 RepID=A0ABV6BNS6_9FLAO